MGEEMKNKLIKHIPNTLTLMNLLCGLSAILVLVQSENPHKLLVAPALIMLGAFSDFFDGFLARKLNVVTEIGKQLDSFSDMITFGIAPILLINYTSLCESALFIISSSSIFIMAGAYRLARYNLCDFSEHFIGFPITAAGLSLTIYCLLYPFWCSSLHPHFCTAITTLFLLLLSVMMISRKKVARCIF